MSHAFLALAAFALLAVIAAQDYLYAPLRNETVSSGLTGPYHVLLDAAYVPLAATLCMAFHGRPVMEFFAIIAAVALLLVAATNTGWHFFDWLAGAPGAHSVWHSRFTLVVFLAGLALQISGDHGLLWGFTILTLIVPAAGYLYFHFRQTDIEGIAIAASPAAEKLYILGLCVWLIAWAL